MLGLIARVAARGGSAASARGRCLRYSVRVRRRVVPVLRAAAKSAGGMAVRDVDVAAGGGERYRARTSLGARSAAHKLLPRVSPNKTVEGAIGGLAAAVAAGLILRPLLAARMEHRRYDRCFAATVAMLAQIGDLAGSAFKSVGGSQGFGMDFPGPRRTARSNLFSLVFAAVFTYYYSLMRLWRPHFRAWKLPHRYPGGSNDDVIVSAAWSSQCW